MKKCTFVLMIMLSVISTIGLSGCGGGGGATANQTPTGTVVSLAAFRSVYLGTATGTQLSFPLSGSDSQGRTWTGSYTIVADGATTFEAQNVTKRRSLITLQLAGGTAVSATATDYFLQSNGNPYKSVSNTGVTYTPNSSATIPSSAKVGDFGDLGTVTGSDGTTIAATWSLAPGSNGNSTLAISTVSKSGTTITATEVDRVNLDPSGAPTSISISVTIIGVTVNLTGNKL